MPLASKFVRTILFALALSLIALFSLGCGSSSSSSSGTTIRFVNASPDQDSVNVLIDGVTVTTALMNGGTATAYLPVASGARRIQIQDPNSLQFLIDTTPTISGTNTTYIVTNHSNALAPLILTDTNTAPTTGDFSLRAINVAPEANAGADVFLVPASTSTLTGVTPNDAGLLFPVATSYITNAVGSGSWEVVFTKPGQTAPTGFYVVPSPITLAVGQVETVLLLEVNGVFTEVPLVDVQ